MRALAAATTAILAIVTSVAPQLTAFPVHREWTEGGSQLQAGPLDRMYRYGPQLLPPDVTAASSNFVVTYAGFPPEARAAFQAAIDLLSNLVSSPVPIRVMAWFVPLGPSTLGQARPSAFCTTPGGIANTVYAAALADKLNGASFCASSAGETHELIVFMNSARSDWDFGTDPVFMKYNFITVATHELLHAIGFLGSMNASGGRGSYSNPPQIYDRFAETGAGLPLLAFPNQSFELGTQLISDDTYFDGAFAVGHNYGLRPRLETGFFPDGDLGFRAGTSYSHLDDGSYSATPNGIMTPFLDRAEVYTDPGPIVRGMLRDLGWGLLGTTQFLQQGGKLIGSGAVGQSRQGRSVAVSSDGNTAIVGGPFDDGGRGAVWVWSRSGGRWSQVGGKLVGSGALGPLGPLAHQGASVALSADGNTAVVGGPDDGFTGNVGAVWVWTRAAGVWAQVGSKLVGTGGIFAQGQGEAVAISADGRTILVGGPNDDGDTGAVWAWTRNGDVWTQQGGKLVPSDIVGEYRPEFGSSVALSADGNTALIGAPRDSNNLGAAWVWTRASGVWRQQAKLSDPNFSHAGAFQGSSVSLSADGNTAMVASNDGARIWTRSAEQWTKQATLDTLRQFGFSSLSVSLSANGVRALVGGRASNGTLDGAVLFVRTDGTWRLNGIKLVGTGAGRGEASGSAAISGDGMTAVIGGEGDSGSIGAAWIFTAPADDILVPTPPLATTATAKSTTQIDVTWIASAGATSYQIERRTAQTQFSTIGTSFSTTFSDHTAVAGAAYQYRVRAVNVAGAALGTPELATTVIFDDDPLMPGTFAKASHLSQLRAAVNAVRSLAGLSAFVFSDPAVPGVVIRANHITELRTSVDAAWIALGLATSPYTDSSLTGAAIKAIHVQELRERVR